MFNIIKVRHELWMAKYPNTPGGSRLPAHRHRECAPGNQGGGTGRVDPSKHPVDPREFIKQLKGREGAELDRAE
jgi:hypothetical protein